MSDYSNVLRGVERDEGKVCSFSNIGPMIWETDPVLKVHIPTQGLTKRTEDFPIRAKTVFIWSSVEVSRMQPPARQLLRIY